MHDHGVSDVFASDPRTVWRNPNLVRYEQRNASIDSAVSRHVRFISWRDVRAQDIIDANGDQIG
jgi:hypothetical protein